MKKMVVCLCVLALVFSSCLSNQAGDPGTSGGSPQAAGVADAGPVPVETKVKVMFADGSLDEYTISEYDNLLDRLETQKRFSASEALLEQTEYEYQEGNGLLTTKITRDGEAVLRNQVEFQYNDSGRLWRETLRNKSGKAVSSFEYSYDASGNRIKRIVNSGTNIKMAETVYSLNITGLPVSSETRDGSGRRISSTQNQYDSDNNLINQTVYDTDGQVDTVINTVWEDGKDILSEQIGPDGIIQLRITNEYGNSRELLKKTVENFRGDSTQIFEYEYTVKPAVR